MFFRKMIRNVPGASTHRSGWPYAMAALEPYFSNTASVLLDDYVDRTFRVDRPLQRRVIHRDPWIGIFHHPPVVPAWCGPIDLQAIVRTAEFQASLPALRLAVTFSPHAADWLKDHIAVPTAVVPHPAEWTNKTWSPEILARGSCRPFVQIGSFLRNTEAINQVSVPDEYQKIELIQRADWITAARVQNRQHYGYRPNVGCVTERSALPVDQYDDLLAQAVVFVELIESVANNTIQECIVRGAPIFCNRMPGPEFYLGKDYPLFYDEIGEVMDLLTDGNLLFAHEYLRDRAAGMLDGPRFAAKMEEVAISHFAPD